MKVVNALDARIRAEVDRLAASSILHGSETLCRLLRFLVEHYLEAPDTPIKEYEIATRLLGRPADFDPRIDPVVRVQVGRLRSKLLTYYATEGANDELILEIPKGSYTPHILDRSDFQPPAPPAPEPPRRLLLPSVSQVQLAIATIGALGLIFAGWYTAGLRANVTRARTVSPTDRSAPLLGLWNPFIRTGQPVLVVFSNAPFVGRPETGLRYFNPARDKAADLLDHYTGIGEVFAVNSLTRMFAGWKVEMQLKRGQLLSWDDARTRPLVFVGSPAENLRLRDLTFHQKYVFQEEYAGERRSIFVKNTAPDANEPAEYRPDRPESERADYALITRTTGLDGATPILMLAGITTLGTQAAVDFATDAKAVEELAARFGSTFPPSFSALLAVEVKGGVPVRARLVGASPAVSITK